MSDPTDVRAILLPGDPDGAYESLKWAMFDLDNGATSRSPAVRERLLRVYWMLVKAEIALTAGGDVDP